MGWPVAHSRSPLIHRYWLERYGIAGDYIKLPVPPEKLGEELRSLVARRFVGCNLTIPHKQIGMTFMDEVDRPAREIGAINTVIVREDGTLFGSNSDALGFIENLKAEAPDWSAIKGPAVVLGSGGASRAIVSALLHAGVPELRLINRTRERAVALAKQLGAEIKIEPWEHRAHALDGAALLVNTTSLGMTGAATLDLSLDSLPREAVVNDIVYTPLETPLLAAARRRGNIAVDGLGMLLHQARPGFAAWFGVEPEVTKELRAHIAATLTA
jgi:shikimate dehydrogenase